MALGEHDDDLEEPEHRDPLPPDDRLWRHPSELDELPDADADADADAERRSGVGKLLASLFPRQRP